MPVTAIISVITILIIASMIFSGISYSRQQAMKKRKAQINKYRQQADEAISHLSLLLKIDDKFELICQLQHLVVSALQAAYNLTQDDPLITNNLRIQKELLKQFKDGNRENKVTCYTTNDTELTQALSQIGQISKLIDIYRNRGSISSAKSQALQAHLQTIKVDLSINSNLYQADSFAEEGDITMYQMHIKQALEVLKKSPIENQGKNARIKHLSSLLNEIKKTNKIVGDTNLIKPDKEKSKTKDTKNDSERNSEDKEKPED